MADSKKAKVTQSSAQTSKSTQQSFERGFEAGRKVASAARQRRESEVNSLAQIKTRF